MCWTSYIIVHISWNCHSISTLDCIMHRFWAITLIWGYMTSKQSSTYYVQCSVAFWTNCMGIRKPKWKFSSPLHLPFTLSSSAKACEPSQNWGKSCVNPAKCTSVILWQQLQSSKAIVRPVLASTTFDCEIIVSGWLNTYRDTTHLLIGLLYGTPTADRNTNFLKRHKSQNLMKVCGNNSVTQWANTCTPARRSVCKAVPIKILKSPHPTLIFIPKIIHVTQCAPGRPIALQAKIA